MPWPLCMSPVPDEAVMSTNFLPHRCAVRRAAESRQTKAGQHQIDIQEPIVVDIAEVCAHRNEDFVETGLRSYIFECAVVEIPVELHRIHVIRQLHVAAYDVVRRNAGIARHEYIRPTVVVVVEKPRGKSGAGSLYSGLLGYLCKCSIVVVMVEIIGAGEVRYIEIDIPIVVVVRCCNSLAVCGLVDARCVRDIFKCPSPRFRNSWLGEFSLAINRSR